MKINSKALILSTLGTVWLLVIMTILTEVAVSFKTLLVQLFGHHWVGKSVVSVLFFFGIYLLSRRADESTDISKGIYLVIGSVFAGGLIIFSFFLFHFLVS